MTSQTTYAIVHFRKYSDYNELKVIEERNEDEWGWGVGGSMMMKLNVRKIGRKIVENLRTALKYQNCSDFDI